MDILDYYTEQETVCGSKLKTSGIIVLFKWKQIQRTFVCFKHIFVMSRKKKSTSSFGIDPEQPRNVEHFTAPDVYLCVLGRCIQIKPNISLKCGADTAIQTETTSSSRLIFGQHSELAHLLCLRGRILESAFLTFDLISAGDDQTLLLCPYEFPCPQLARGSVQANWSLPKDAFLPVCESGGRKVPMGPQINVLRDCRSLHYKERWLGESRGEACQSDTSLGCCVSVGGVELRRQCVIHLHFLASHQVRSWEQSGGVPACGHLAHMEDAIVTRCPLRVTFTVSSFETIPGK